MAETSIEWTDHSINPLRARAKEGGGVGHYCEKVSPGCTHCYSSRFQVRRGLPTFGSGQHREEVELFLDKSKLSDVLRRQKPTKYFWCDMTDLFGEWVPDGWIMRCFEVMAKTPWHTHQLLTKRPERMKEFFAKWNDTSGEDFGDFKDARGPEATRKAHPSPRGQLFAAMLETMGEPPPGCAFPTFDWAEGMMRWPNLEWFSNIWLGTSVEDLARKGRIDVLRSIPAAVRFLSCEPLIEGLGDLGLTCEPCDGTGGYNDARNCESCRGTGSGGIHWVICGGESGPGARPMHPDWARSIRDQCQAAGVAFFFKQWGEWAPASRFPNGKVSLRVGKKAAGRLLDGREWNEYPETAEVAKP